MSLMAHGFPENGRVFENTPVSLILICAFGVFRAIPSLPFVDSSVFEYKPETVLSGEVWRILSSKFCIFETRDFFTCVFLIFYFRTLERRLGTGRFVNVLLGNLILSCLVEFGFLHLLRNISEELVPANVPAGPFYAVYPLLLWAFSECGTADLRYSQSDSSITAHMTLVFFILVSQGMDLAFSSWTTASWFSFVCSMLAGALYRDNFLCFRSHLTIPRKFFPKRPADVSTRKVGATIEVQRSMRAEYLEQQVLFNSNILRNTRPPPDNLVRQLTEMGFSLPDAVQALQATDNNLQMATNILLHQ